MGDRCFTLHNSSTSDEVPGARPPQAPRRHSYRTVQKGFAAPRRSALPAGKSYGIALAAGTTRTCAHPRGATHAPHTPRAHPRGTTHAPHTPHSSPENSASKADMTSRKTPTPGHAHGENARSWQEQANATANAPIAGTPAASPETTNIPKTHISPTHWPAGHRPEQRCIPDVNAHANGRKACATAVAETRRNRTHPAALAANA